MKTIIIGIFSVLFSLSSGRSAPLLQSFMQSSKNTSTTIDCDRIFDERAQAFICMENVAPVKRSIDEFRAISLGVKSYLSTLNLISNSSKTQLDKFFAAADTNTDKMISKEEMTAYADSTNQTFTANDMNQAWVLFDGDSDGNISQDEFTAVIE
jgi:Ca2+-binding EF-hand superfamily protein